MKFIVFLCVLIAVPLTTAAQMTPQNTEKVPLVRFGKGTAAIMVEDHLMKLFPEHSDSAPSHTVGLMDLNGDQTPEIFVRIDHEYKFCNEDNWCDSRIFVYQGTGLIEIAQFESGGEIRVSNETTNNIRNVLVGRKDGRYDLYIWSGQGYQKVTQ